MSIEALEIIASLCADKVLTQDEENILRKALAKQEQGEPVATVADLYPYRRRSCGLPENTNLYTTPQQRKPLTDEQIVEMWQQYNPLHGIASFARAIEAAHGIKE